MFWNTLFPLCALATLQKSLAPLSQSEQVCVRRDEGHMLGGEKMKFSAHRPYIERSIRYEVKLKWNENAIFILRFMLCTRRVFLWKMKLFMIYFMAWCLKSPHTRNYELFLPCFQFMVVIGWFWCSNKTECCYLFQPMREILFKARNIKKETKSDRSYNRALQSPFFTFQSAKITMVMNERNELLINLAIYHISIREKVLTWCMWNCNLLSSSRPSDSRAETGCSLFFREWIFEQSRKNCNRRWLKNELWNVSCMEMWSNVKWDYVEWFAEPLTKDFAFKTLFLIESWQKLNPFSFANSARWKAFWETEESWNAESSKEIRMSETIQSFQLFEMPRKRKEQ